MGSDIDKAVELLMTMLGGKDNSEETAQEEYNEISAEEDAEDTVLAEEEGGAGFSNLLGDFTGGKDKRVTLLSSIKPYMSGKRQEKVDVAINMVRLLSVSSTLGLGKLFDIR